MLILWINKSIKKSTSKLSYLTFTTYSTFGNLLRSNLHKLPLFITGCDPNTFG